YDRFGENFRQIPEDYDERVAAAAGARGGGPRVRFHTDRGENFAGSDVDFDDLFGGIFGRGGPGGPRGPIPGADQEAEIQLGVEDAYRGGKRSITLGGPGGQPRTVRGQHAPRSRRRAAHPAGRRGREGQWRRPAGDLFLRVRIKPDSRFRLDGRDVHVQAPVAPWEAALGATVPVPTPGGGTAKVTVPAGSSSGRRLRLRGEGMPNPRGANGDLYAEVRIVVPPTLGDRERELFEELAATSSYDPRRTR
ncbi:J domain-containing protein, partial [Streptomyces avermitilis]